MPRLKAQGTTYTFEIMTVVPKTPQHHTNSRLGARPDEKKKNNYFLETDTELFLAKAISNQFR